MREALRSKRRKLKELYVATSLEPTPALTEILRLAEDAMVSVRVVPKDRLERLARTEVHQGVVLRGEVLPMADVDDLLEAESSFLLALDGVTDPQNLGAILRSAEGAGVTGVLLPKHRAVHVTPAVAKAAAGAVEYVPIGLIPGVAALLDKARKAGIWIVGLDGAGTTDVFDAAPVGQRVMLVLGAEGTGLSRLVMERCDVLVRIPMAGRLGSLNVSAAAALACFEIGRRRH